MDTTPITDQVVRARRVRRLVVLLVSVLVGAAGMSRRRRAIALHDAVAPPRPGPVVDQPCRADGEGVRMVVNPDSGPMLSPDPTPILREALPEAELIELTEDLDLDEVLRRPGAEVLGAAGGDGTINCVAAIAADLGLPMLAAPAGTFNHLCADARIDSVEQAIEAVKHGEAIQVDVGRIDGHIFMNTATLGLYVELVDVRERFEKRIGKFPALLVALVLVLGRGEPMDLEIDGRHRRIWLLFAGNGTYHPRGMLPVGRPRLDDGLLDVRLIDGSVPWARTRLVGALLVGRLSRTKAYEERPTESISICSRAGSLRVAIDGETCDVGDSFDIKKQSLGLSLFSPAKPAI
jgi:undecaprenyl-diphosphatase